jgi:NACalpha-BTF3-like transcription factor
MKVTLEMIDELRSRVNVTYEEAKEALENNEGDIVKSIIALERKRKEDPTIGSKTKKKEEFSKQANKTVNSFLSVRLILKNEKTTLINVPLVIAVISLIVAPWLIIPGIVIALILGYKLRISSTNKTSDKIKKGLDKATKTVKKSTEKIFEESENLEENDEDSDEDEVIIE